MIRNFIKLKLYFFLFFCVIFIPFPFYVFSFQPEISEFLFGNLINKLIEEWGIVLENPAITSDSLNLYILVFILLVCSVFIAFILLFFKNWKNYQEKIYQGFQILFTFYLSMQLLKYGFDKVFKSQFYLPEPNILYTPLGQISKDLLFWSSMGTSYSYNIFMGLLEVIPAIFLLFKKTRIIGLLIVIPVLINIMAINFSFDISVKVYSLFLLSLALFLIFPFLRKLYDFFIKEKTVNLKTPKTPFIQNPVLYRSFKSFVIGLIFIEALFPSLTTLNFNDDKTARPYLHGAYEMQSTYSDKQKLSNEEIDIKRLFIHRRGYLIFQNNKDEMQDFNLRIDTIQKHFILTNYQEQQSILRYDYHEKDSLLDLQYFKKGKEYKLVLKSLDWKNLPLMQNDFHWYIEEVKH